MNAALFLIIGCAVLVVGYIFYGGWLAKKWGVDNSRPTPAHTMEDGKDYCPAKAPVLMGHHFSSIAGAGPINGPIQAAVFGWVPVMLWVLIGGIFFGGVHDFGALFASIRHKGESIGEVIGDAIGAKAKKLFITFAYLTLILVVAAFASIVANTFKATYTADGAVDYAASAANASTAIISIMFILMAIIFGFFVYRRNAPLGISTIIGIIVGCISGYFGGWVDILLMRVTEIVGAIPFLPFALVLSAILQSSDLHENTRIFIIMLILGLLSWTGLAKLIRGQILAEREKEFVTAARSMGVKEGRIAFKHILPNVISVILVSVTLDFAGCMLTESSLSYLGFGVQLPRPTWGNMLDGSRNALVIQSYWWRWVFPALFLSIVVICINIIGDTLREVLDPKSEVDK